MTLLDKEPVKRVENILKEFDAMQKVVVLDTSARTALEAASSLGCEVGAIVKSLLFKAGVEKRYLTETRGCACNSVQSNNSDGR